MFNFKMLPPKQKPISKHYYALSIICKYTTHFLQCLTDKNQTSNKRGLVHLESSFHLQLKKKRKKEFGSKHSSAVSLMQAL